MEYSPLFPQLRILSNAQRAKTTILLFRIIALVVLLDIILRLCMLFSIKGGQPSMTAVIITGIYVLLSYIPYGCLSVFFILWMKRAYDNLLKAGVKSLSYNKGWVIIGWFVPLANFVIPGKMMREIWSETQQAFYHEPVTEIYDDSIVRYWWGTYVASSVISVVALFILDGRDLELGYSVIIIANIFLFLSALYGAKMVRDLSEQEEEMVKRGEKFYQREISETAKNYLENPTQEFIQQNVYPTFPTEENEKVELKGAFVDNSKRSGFVIIGLVILMGVFLGYAGICFYIFSDLTIYDFMKPIVSMHKYLINLLPIGLIILSFTGIVGLLWMHRAYSNLYNLGVKELLFGPAMTVYGWFIPVANIFIPCAILLDINKYSQKALEEKETQSDKPIANTISIFIFWALFLLSATLIMLSFYLFNISPTHIDYNEVLMGACAGMSGSLIAVATLGLGFVLIKNISRIETELFQKIEKRFGEETIENENKTF